MWTCEIGVKYFATREHSIILSFSLRNPTSGSLQIAWGPYCISLKCDLWGRDFPLYDFNSRIYPLRSSLMLLMKQAPNTLSSISLELVLLATQPPSHRSVRISYTTSLSAMHVLTIDRRTGRSHVSCWKRFLKSKCDTIGCRYVQYNDLIRWSHHWENNVRSQYGSLNW